MSDNNSRLVEIHRKLSFLHESQEGMEDWFADASRSIGSFFAKRGSKRIGSGLTFEEEKLLMPSLIGCPAHEREFRDKVEAFFCDITTPINDKGRVFEIGLENNDKKLGEPLNEGEDALNLPINIEDYVRFRHASSHPMTSPTKAASEGNQLKKWYILDKEDVLAREKVKTEDLDKALEQYLLFRDDEKKRHSILTLMKVNIKKLNPTEQITELRNKAEKESKDFFKIATDKDLNIKYWLTKAITAKILKNVGMRFLIVESGDVIGDSIDETVLWIKDDKNAAELSILKARLQEWEKLEKEKLNK